MAKEIKAGKDTGVSLLQKSADGFAMARAKSVPLHGSVGVTHAGSRNIKPIKALNLPLCIGLAVTLVAGVLALMANRDRLLASVGYQSVPSLPMPSASLGPDDQALYWTYALYDIGKLRSRFRIEGYYAISRGRARHELELLLPKVAHSTLGEISAYGSVAFRAVRPSRAE